MNKIQEAIKLLNDWVGLVGEDAQPIIDILSVSLAEQEAKDKLIAELQATLKDALADIHKYEEGIGNEETQI